jgi:hypothetical protein
MRRLALLTLLAGLSGCSHTGYSGDGRFTDNGVMTYSRRYVIDLGPVNLSAPGSYTYKLSGLPRAEFNVSIRVSEGTQNTWNSKPDYPATVRVLMRTAQGETVISEEGPLNSFVRSYGVLDDISELYRRGIERDKPLPGGGARPEPLGVKASGGWGTYFHSDADKTYLLELHVLSSQGWGNRPARLMVNGWDRS